MTRAIAALGTALALAFAAPAVASDLVVLESNVAALSAGSVVPAAQSVSLDGGARLVLIAPDGSARTVQGPYSGPIGKAGADAPGMLERLTNERKDSNHVVSAIRAPSRDQ